MSDQAATQPVKAANITRTTSVSAKLAGLFTCKPTIKEADCEEPGMWDSSIETNGKKGCFVVPNDVH